MVHSNLPSGVILTLLGGAYTKAFRLLVLVLVSASCFCVELLTELLDDIASKAFVEPAGLIAAAASTLPFIWSIDVSVPRKPTTARTPSQSNQSYDAMNDPAQPPSTRNW